MKKLARPSKDPIIAAKQLMDKITKADNDKNYKQTHEKKNRLRQQKNKFQSIIK